MQKEFNEEQYSVMRTAMLTAFPKIFTNIIYSSEIFNIMKDLAIENGFSFSPDLFNNKMAIEIEARHKALSSALAKHISKDTLVVEIAAGFSPRHLEFKEYNYVEVDFKPVMEIKKQLYSTLGFNSITNRLFDADLSVSNELEAVLNKIKNSFKFKQVIILNEGLFWYLTKTDIQNMTKTIQSSLDGTDWMWITTDCPAEKKNTEEYRKVISNSANSKRGTFIDYNDFTEFFNTLGLSNNRFKLSDFVSFENLSSANLFSVNKTDTINKIESYTDIAIFKPTK